MPNTQSRRDETVLSRRRCEHNSQLAHDDKRAPISTSLPLKVSLETTNYLCNFVTKFHATHDGDVSRAGKGPQALRTVFLLQTFNSLMPNTHRRRDETVLSRRRRRCEHSSQLG